MAVLWYGGYRVIEGHMTPGTLFSFTAAALMLYGPVRRLSRSLNVVQQSTASVERVFHILELPPAITDRPGATRLETFTRALAFERVDFRYGDADEMTLKEISLEIRKGEVVAFVACRARASPPSWTSCPASTT